MMSTLPGNLSRADYDERNIGAQAQNQLGGFHTPDDIALGLPQKE